MAINKFKISTIPSLLVVMSSLLIPSCQNGEEESQPDWFFGQSSFYEDFTHAEVEEILTADKETIIIPTFYQIPDFPKTFNEFQPPAFLLKKIDKIVEAAIQTTTGKHLCAALRGRLDLTRELTGVSEGSAKRVLEYCHDNGYDEVIEDTQLDRLRIRLQNDKPKKMRFVLLDEAIDIQSFTFGISNETFLFLTEDDLTIENFALAIIHEIFMTVDSPHLTNRGGLQTLADNNYELVNLGSADQCSLLKVMARPSIATTFETIRAFNLEYQIALDWHKEYGFKIPESLKAFNEQLASECQQTATKTLERLILPTLDLGMTDQSYYVFPELVTGCFDYGFTAHSDKKEDREADFEQLTHYFETVSLENTQTGNTIPLCEFAAKPVISPFSKIYNSGPKPRIGRGW